MSTPGTPKKFREPRIAFIKRIEQVQQYIEITNSGWVTSNYRFPEWTGISGNFGAWAAWARCEKKQGRLRKKQVDALDRLGFIWDKDDVEKVMSRARIMPTTPVTPFGPNHQSAGTDDMVGRERTNSILRTTRTRLDGYPETVRDVGAAEDFALSFGLLYSEAITQYARADTAEALARQNARPVLDRLRGMDLGRITMDNATIVLWTPPSLFCEVEALFCHWGFSLCHAGYWRKGVTPGHCHTRDPYEYYLVGTRGAPSWGLTMEYGRFLRGYVGSHIQQEDRLIQIFQAACDGPGLEIFGTTPRPGWTVLQEPQPGGRRGNGLLRRTAALSPVPQLATELF